MPLLYSQVVHSKSKPFGIHTQPTYLVVISSLLFWKANIPGRVCQYGSFSNLLLMWIIQRSKNAKKSMNTSSVIGMYGWGFCREGTESGKRLCRDQPTADQPNGWLKSPPVVVFVTVTVNAVMYAGHGSNHSSSQCTSHCNPLPLTTALLCPNFGCNYMSNLQICTCHCLCHYLPKTYAVITCPIC